MTSKDQGNHEQKQAAEGIRQNGRHKKRALLDFVIAKAHNQGVVQAARAAVKHETADHSPNSNIAKRDLNQKMVESDNENDRFQILLHAERNRKNEQHVQCDERNKQGDQEHLAATASDLEINEW